MGSRKTIDVTDFIQECCVSLLAPGRAIAYDVSRIEVRRAVTSVGNRAIRRSIEFRSDSVLFLPDPGSNVDVGQTSTVTNFFFDQAELVLEYGGERRSNTVKDIELREEVFFENAQVVNMVISAEGTFVADSEDGGSGQGGVPGA